MKTRNERTNVEMQKYRHKSLLQKYCLEIIREGGLNGSADALQGASQMFDTAGNLRLVPKFNERDPDNFFYIVLANSGGKRLA